MSSSKPTTTEAVTHSAEDTWVYYQLPIFYTLQPNPPTRHKQLSLWADVLVQSAFRHCALASKELSSWENENASLLGEGVTTSTLPPATVRTINSKLTGLPSDKCPFAVLFTADDDIFTNGDLQRRLPKAAVPLVFQAAMLQYPNRCISNVPLTFAMRAPGDDILFQQAQTQKEQQLRAAKAAASDDSMGSWLSSVFRRSGASERDSNSQQNTPVQQSQPQQQATEESNYWLVVFTNTGGHVTAMTDHVMPWVMESAGGLTTANLKKNGVITTFDEMCAENALAYNSSEGGSPITLSYTAAVPGMPSRFLPQSSSTTVKRSLATASTNAVTNEHVLRVLLHFYQHSPAAVPVARITLFNLDESERQPYEGVKFGGEGA